MLVSEFLANVSYALRGTDENAPTVGDDDATYWLSILNRKKSELYRNANVLYDETFEIRDVDTITATATPEYSLDDDFIAPSDQIYIVDTNSKKHYFTLIKPRERANTGRQFYIAGMNPKTVYCTDEITATDQLVGGTLYVPGYYLPADVASASEEIPLPDPYWGVMSVASEVAFNDIVYEDKAADLNSKANALYMQMLRINRRGSYDQPRKIPTNTYKIRSPWR